MLNIIKDCLIVKASNGAAAGTTEVDSNIVDCHGYNAVTFLVDVGTVTSGSVMTAQVQDNTANSTSGMANVGTAATVTDSGGATSNSIVAVEVTNIQKRYVRCAFTRTTANAVVNSIIAICHQANVKPVTLDATISASAVSNAAS